MSPVIADGVTPTVTVGATLSLTKIVESLEVPVNPLLSIAIAFTLWDPTVAFQLIEYGAVLAVPM